MKGDARARSANAVAERTASSDAGSRAERRREREARIRKQADRLRQTYSKAYRAFRDPGRALRFVDRARNDAVLAGEIDAAGAAVAYMEAVGRLAALRIYG